MYDQIDSLFGCICSFLSCRFVLAYITVIPEVKSVDTGTTWISTVYGIVDAICEHIISQDTLTSGSIGVGIDESAQFGIVIAGLEIVES